MIGGSYLNMRRLVAWMIALIAVSVGILSWSGYRAIREWRRSSLLFAKSQAEDAANLLVTALTRDMRAVQTAVLPSLDWRDFLINSPGEARDAVATTFARYPYPDSFFALHWYTAGKSAVFFVRTDRPPRWVGSLPRSTRAPVSVLTDDAVTRLIARRIDADIRRRREFSVFELPLDQRPYQIVALIHYHDHLQLEPVGVIGFMVDLAWARQHYFPQLTEEIARMTERAAGIVMSIVDDRKQPVASTLSGPRAHYVSQRDFQVFFFDSLLIELDPPSDISTKAWLVQVDATGDRTLAAAIRVANLLLILTSGAVTVLVFGLALTYGAVRASANLAELRSEFISTITHEVKAPIAKIRAAGDTLVSGRIGSQAKHHEYARLVVREARHLTRLVDNMLAFSRITDVASVYSFEPIDVGDVLESVLRQFRKQLVDAGFEVHTVLPAPLPPVRADSTALELMFDNIIDNAIRYSGDSRSLRVEAVIARDHVRIDVSDSGRGIPADEIGDVTRRFFRGRHSGSGGTGLGLAIVKRIVADHHGRLDIHSVLHSGTTVSVRLPILCDDDEEANPDR
jgi:signal transduction histidine kinase